MKLDKRFFLSIFIWLATIAPVAATTHVINFGGSLGDTYSPNTMNVSVGDTIKWIGSFSFHPLQSTSVPANAQSFGPISSGSSFIYVVTVAGNYAYQCNIHVSLGMIGSFLATEQSDVNNQSLVNAFSLEQNFPNPYNGMTAIRYTLNTPSEISLKVFDLSGKEIKQIENGYENAGDYEILYNANALPDGTYFYQLQAGDAVLTRQMIVLKR